MAVSARPIPVLRVIARSARDTRARLVCGTHSVPCALGAGGRRVNKREADGATPSGIWPVRDARYRPDRQLRPRSGLAMTALRPGQGWCDGPESPFYNRPVPYPFRTSAETLWRKDALYDLMVMIGYNDRPVQPGRGSAIFLHVARDGFTPTEGCIALARDDLMRLLPRLSRRTVIVVP